MKENLTLSHFINIVRAYLLGRDFFEHRLYSSVPYKIENTDYFKLKDGLFLRVNPEPDIWEIGTEYDHFFWIGSMFRKEKKLSSIHQYEFTVADIYLKNGSQSDVLNLFFSILDMLEERLGLKKLSESLVQYMTYEEFHTTKLPKSKDASWIVVTDYPNNESFFDQKIDTSKTSKFEIYFVKNGEATEIAACGTLGDNRNEKQYIQGKNSKISKKLLDKKFIGFGFGMERLIRIYGK
jgi:hypothetical protein